MELDGTIVGKFGKAGKALKEFSTRPRDRLPQPERAVRLGDHRLAGAEDSAVPQPMKSSGGR